MIRPSSFTVIIPCLNEERYLPLVLGDLAGQTVRPTDIVVVDSRSEDGTVAVARDWAKQLPIRVITSQKRSPAYARNTGAAATNTEYLLFVDADMRLPKDFFTRVIRAERQHPVDYLTPRWRTDSRNRIDHVVLGLCNLMQAYAARRGRVAGIGGTMCVRRKAFEAVGGFDTSFHHQEDIDFTRRLSQRHASYTFLKDLVLTYSDRRSNTDNLWQQLFKLVHEKTWLYRHVVLPMSRKTGNPIQFGHYNK